MKFWKRWLRFLTDEEEHEQPAGGKRMDHRTERAEAKVVYQYPQGRFRFPLIPDDHSPRAEETLRRMAGEESKVKAPRRPIADPVRESAEKKPFRPSDVPSPVFGYDKNRNEWRQRLTEQGTIAAVRIADKASHRPGMPTVNEQAGNLSSDQALLSRPSHLAEAAAPQGTLQRVGRSGEEGAAAGRPTEKEKNAKADAAVHIATSDAEQRINEATGKDVLGEAPFTETVAEAKERPAELVKEEAILGEPAFTGTAAETEEQVEGGTPAKDGVSEANAALTRPAVKETEQTDGLIWEEEGVSDARSAAAMTMVEPAAAEMKDEQAHVPPGEVATAAEPEGSFHEGGDIRSAARTEENRLSQPDHGGDEQQKETMKLSAESDNGNARAVSQEGEEGPLRLPLPPGETKRPIDRHRPERARVPYNVMMLKQDRRKLEEKAARRPGGYSLPPLSLLTPPGEAAACDEQWIREQCARLDRTFESFHIGAKVVHATQGPTVTQFEVQPDLGVKVSKITSLTDDIKLSLAARDIRIEAPIPGKRTIGIEVPNPSSRPVQLREILESRAFRERRSPLTVALGLDISGAPIVTDIQKMPHGLIAGATGSGKSVCMNAMLVSMLYKAAPHEVKWLLIDPKMVELAPYNGLPHLLSPVITEAKAAAGALKWAVGEMERRYELFVHAGVRDIEKYNASLHAQGDSEPLLPYIVIVIDELADLMMAAPADVEESICRLAQKARACGIHLLIATQRPSVDVITGLIKANIPTRIAFSVSSQIDSRTILDANGAERLLGRGDMLFLENGSAKPVRLQGCFISDEEMERVTAYVKAQQEPSYLFSPDEFRQTAAFGEEDDELFDEACRFVIAQGGASTSSLQRHFRIGYNRAARLIEMMEEQGLISEARGSKPRDVLMSEEEWARWRERGALQADGFSPSER
ncbi:cell division protein FtsK [Geobacillus sp. 46C-IIa]|uniref:DNA translocase FtsK n=1 Tax=Geobacillus sp. 46C-IIa TaxID=1963025 RepID=UPI0009BD4BE2|nr:DNA translocase FtsK [Geobacillus sp. 46C-IIa]OQP06486.1 cell division protein FtsK [Geobacillus sp. 46C-IIa]QNU28504.1 DNA translocase FtsK [Geobacillus sp. 46C-IIa]